MADVIRCEGLSCGYAGVKVLRNVSFRLRRGESMLLIGHNGAGKSTLLKTLFGLQAPLGGRADVCGLRAGEGHAEALIRRGARFLGQGPRGFDALSVPQQRNVLTRLYGMAPDGGEPSPGVAASRLVGGLSGGQKRLEALRMLEAGEPELFLLDEPLAGVDIHNSSAILDWIVERQQAGVSFVVADHQFREFLPLIDTTMAIRRGVVTFHDRSDKLQAEARLADVYL